MHKIASCVRAAFLSVLIYFLIFLFDPATSVKYLGTSFKEVHGGAVDDLYQVLDESDVRQAIAEADPSAVGKLVHEEMDKAGSYTGEQMRAIEKALEDPETKERVQKAARKGGSALRRQVSLLLERQ